MTSELIYFDFAELLEELRRRFDTATNEAKDMYIERVQALVDEWSEK